MICENRHWPAFVRGLRVHVAGAVWHMTAKAVEGPDGGCGWAIPLTLPAMSHEAIEASRPASRHRRGW